VNIRGVFTAQAKTQGHPACELTAPTGTKRYPAAAPGPFLLSVSADPSSSKRVDVTIGGYGTLFASLGNGYFGTECSTSTNGEPDEQQLMVVSIPKSRLLQKKLVIRSHGATSADKIAYRWSTTFVLERVSAG
jgi:hypothetical protein